MMETKFPLDTVTNSKSMILAHTKKNGAHWKAKARRLSWSRQ